MYRYIAPFILLIFIPLFFIDKGPQSLRELRHDPHKHVEDFANVMNDVERDSIESLCVHFLKIKKVNIVVATLESTEGREAAAYAVELANKWEIEGVNGAILIMIVPSQHAWQVKVSNQLQCLLTDIDVVRISKKQLLPHLKKNDYGTGLISYVNAISDKIISDDGKFQVLDFLQTVNERNKKTKIFAMVNSVLPIVLLIFTLIMVWVTYKYQSKKIMKASSQALERQQRVDFIIDNCVKHIRETERYKSFNPALNELIRELETFKNDCHFAPSTEIDFIEKKYLQLLEKLQSAMAKAELVCNVSTVVAGIPKVINDMQKLAIEVIGEYEAMWKDCPELMAEIPECHVDNLLEKQIEKIRGLGIDLDNAISLFDTVKFGPIQGALNAARRKFEDVAIEYRNAIASIQNKVKYVNSFEARYRSKIDESSLAVQLDYITPSSRISFENLVPSMLEMLGRLSKVTNFTYKYALCKEIEATYNSAVAGFTKEVAEYSKKQTNNNDAS